MPDSAAAEARGSSPTRAAGPSTPALRGAKNAAQAHRAENADRQANIERIVRLVRMHRDARNVSTVMRLDPPELGRIRLEMHLRDRTLLLCIEPESEVAHRLLTHDLSRLRHGLEAAGLNVERIDVRPVPATRPDGTDGQPEHGSPGAYDGADHPQSQADGQEVPRHADAPWADRPAPEPAARMTDMERSGPVALASGSRVDVTV